jgi:hypothetical protein
MECFTIPKAAPADGDDGLCGRQERNAGTLNIVCPCSVERGQMVELERGVYVVGDVIDISIASG